VAGKRHFLVLTASLGVENALAGQAREALQELGFCAALPRRLAATAVEIGFVGALPQAFDVLRFGLGGAVDANVVAAEERRKRVLIADMDSTIIGVECIDELADYAGVKTEVAKVTEAAMRGELDFEGALIARVGLLKGLPEDVLGRCYRERVRLNSGARTLVRTMNALGAATALVSGGFTFFTERVAAAAGFGFSRANRLILADARLTGEVERPILGKAANLEALEEMVGALGIGTAAAVAVGDGANDLAMVEAAGLGVAYHAKPALARAADARLDHSDLAAILALQGIPESEWVRDDA
jgi:phosphoserine phosphatase